MEIFCFLMGILYVYTSSIYLPIATLLIFFITPRYPIILLFVLGLLLALAHQWIIEPTGFPKVEVLPKAVLIGKIASIPIQTPSKTQFALDIETIDGHPAQGLVQLAWYNKPPALHAGERWRLAVKIKKPHSFQNPGSTNYAGRLATRHIQWTGYIQSKGNQLLTTPHATWDFLELRDSLANALNRLAPDEKTAGILEALSLNITTHISQEEWELFRRTGTIHLFGISGEHIALVSGLLFAVTRWLWSRSATCCLMFPANYIGSIGGCLIALLYAFLAGFEPPVQRALIGCFFYTLSCMGKKKLSTWQVWRYALFGVLCLEPHAALMQGFYFSFLAVACLLLTQQRFRLKGYKNNLALQLSCLIGLMPLTLYWFSYGSINGFIANVFAIPLVGLCIVPLTLITLLMSSFSWAWVLIKPLTWLIALMFQMLIWTEHLAAVNIVWSLSSIEFVIGLMGALLFWIVLPVKPFTHFALLWLLLPLLPARPLVHNGEVLMHVLDVGQGLAVSIQTQHHVLLYDTGDQFFQGSDLGKMVILPYYNALKIKHIDKIVISHPDKDHRGGLKSIQEGMPVNELLVNDPKYYGNHGLKCHEYPSWQWDGVTFRFLSINEPFREKNNTSCILQITSPFGKVLLTGDIEQVAEDYLIKTYGASLHSDVLIIPHHGSKTSSSYRFLLDISPQYAIASLGFDNRFRFPHAKTLNNLQSLGIPFYRTDECGMVEVRLTTQERIDKPTCYSLEYQKRTT